MAKKTDEELIELYARRLSEARRRKAEAVRRAGGAPGARHRGRGRPHDGRRVRPPLP